MSESEFDFGEILQKLNDEDASVRREAADSLLAELLPDEVAKFAAQKLTDPDKGVKDAVSNVLIFNDNPNIATFVVPYISSEDITVRNLAGDVLCKRGTSSIDAMVRYLHTSDDDDKKFIIDILALIGDESPKKEIISVLKQTENENVALACIEALGSMRVVEAIPDLIEVFDKNELYRPVVIETLGKIGSEAVLAFIMERYETVDELTQFSMFESLGQVGDEGTFYFLLTKLKTAQPPVTWAIIFSLRELKERFGLDIPFDESTKNALVNTLQMAELPYRKAAISLLIYFKDAEVIDACLQEYGMDFEIDETIMFIFQENLSVFYSKVSDYIDQERPNLRRLLELFKQMVDMDGGEQLRRLDEVDVHTVLDRLTSCLSHPDEEVRRTTTELLFFIRPETAFVFIDTMIGDTNTWNKLRLIDLLEGMNIPESNTALQELLKDEDDMIRQRVEWVINERGSSDQTRNEA